MKTFKVHFIENGVNRSIAVHAYTLYQAREKFNALQIPKAIIKKVKIVR